jgi:hypothetical protein
MECSDMFSSHACVPNGLPAIVGMWIRSLPSTLRISKFGAWIEVGLTA